MMETKKEDVKQDTKKILELMENKGKEIMNISYKIIQGGIAILLALNGITWAIVTHLLTKLPYMQSATFWSLFVTILSTGGAVVFTIKALSKKVKL